MNRTVEISFATEVGRDYKEQFDSIPEMIRMTQDFHRALGYAIAWGNSDMVRVYVDKDGDINTCHNRKTGEDEYGKPQYVQYFFMLGLRDKQNTTGRYTFHS
jgi:hypothetical protein